MRRGTMQMYLWTKIIRPACLHGVLPATLTVSLSLAAQSMQVPIKGGSSKTGSSAAERSAETRTIYDSSGISVTSRETIENLELTVDEPDPIFVSFEVDRNQNGQYDRLVDVAYRPQANGDPCPQYLIDEKKNTPCGRFPSYASIADFKDDQGRRHFVLVLPKKELSLGRPSVRLSLTFRDNALWQTTFYPSERFRAPIEILFLLRNRKPRECIICDR